MLYPVELRDLVRTFPRAKVVREGGSWKSKVNIQNLSSKAGLFIVETAAGDNSEAGMEGFIFGT